MSIDDAQGDAPVALRIGVDGTVSRVPFVSDETGAGALFREQIGCRMYTMTSLDDLLDMWSDDEAIAHLDIRDQAGLAEVLNPVATFIAHQFGVAQPVFGTVLLTRVTGESAAALTNEQLTELEALAAQAVPAPLDLIIKVENAYSDGHTSEQKHPVQLKRYVDEETLWDELFCYTGDGHGIDNKLNSWHQVTILESPGRPELKGLSNEWC